MVLRRGSQITTNASGTATGGNISINASVLVGFEDSDIVATAVQGSGGNIQITTQGIFGLKYRDRLTPDNDITASSQFGVNGTVQISNPGVDPASGLVNLPIDLVDPSQLIASGCNIRPGSRFAITGRGGIPQNPTQEVRGDRPWSDLRDPSAYRNHATLSQSPSPSPRNAIAEASTLLRSHGQLELIVATAVPRQE